MYKKTGFYGFRGNIEFKDLNLFNYELENNSKEKNRIFNTFFEKLKETKLESGYNKMEYMLIYIGNVSERIIYCQLARKRNYSTYEFENYKIEPKQNADYPFVNVFIDTYSQKILIESKSKVFENPETCKRVIENIMSKTLREKNAYISINPITSEATFWEKVENSKKILSIEFHLNTPNWLDSENLATNFMRKIRENTGADKAKMEFSNSTEGLQLNREEIDSFVEYSTEGAGSWRMKYEDEQTGSKITIKSKSKSKIIYVDLDEEEEWSNNPSAMVRLQHAFNKIEKFDKYKEE